MRMTPARDFAAKGTAHASQRPLRIVHCFRSPLGGIFRHVADLVEEQARAGHAVGVICDSTTGTALEEDVLKRLAPKLALGIRRTPMRRQVSPSDLAATWRLLREVRSLNPDILHAHGAKGGAYARTIGTLLRAFGLRVARIYSPHGGSIHYDPKSLSGRVYFALERVLGWMTDAFIFVSHYEADTYAAKIGKPRSPSAIVLNGLRPDEFEPVAPAPEARDFLFIGEFRDLKGTDLFIEALDIIGRHTGRRPTAWLVGSGPDKTRFEAMVAERNLGDAVTFRERMPARQAFALARVVVMPSRAESMPYIVLETLAAGVPLIATNVGGIPEVFGEFKSELVPPGNAQMLAAAMQAKLARPDEARALAAALRERIKPVFSTEAMARKIAAVYASVTA
ncbi:MAG TPA: glycosyltransferase family 4 protein [Bauldia sp.]|nr:glycosyltransferase family 4 protein [Bauldia sp.]